MWGHHERGLSLARSQLRNSDLRSAKSVGRYDRQGA